MANVAQSSAQSASDLRQRVLLESPTDTPDGLGGYSRAWSSVATVWAQVTPSQGSEHVIAQGVRAQAAYDVRIRYRSDASANWRVTWQAVDPLTQAAISLVLDVHAATDVDGMHQWTDLHCMEGEGS